jgi:hypothetical protein
VGVSPEIVTCINKRSSSLRTRSCTLPSGVRDVAPAGCPHAGSRARAIAYAWDELRRIPPRHTEKPQGKNELPKMESSTDRAARRW